MHQAGKKMRKPQKQKEMYYFPQDMLTLSKKGLMAKAQ